jgi:hypothetical protein
MQLQARKGVSGIEPETILKKLEKYPIRNEKAKALSEAIDFDKTEEGRAYWEMVDGLFKITPSPVDRVKNQLSALPEPIRTEVFQNLHKINYRPHKDMKFAFKWDDTPQGRAYWKLVSDIAKALNNGGFPSTDNLSQS